MATRKKAADTTKPIEPQVHEKPQPDNAKQLGEPDPVLVHGEGHAGEKDPSQDLGIGNVRPDLAAPSTADEPAPAVVQNANDVIHSAPEIVNKGLEKDVGGAPLPGQVQGAINGDPTTEDRLAEAAHEVVRAYHTSKGLKDRGAWADQNTDTRRAVMERMRADSPTDERANGSVEDQLVQALINAFRRK